MDTVRNGLAGKATAQASIMLMLAAAACALGQDAQDVAQLRAHHAEMSLACGATMTNILKDITHVASEFSQLSAIGSESVRLWCSTDAPSYTLDYSKNTHLSNSVSRLPRSTNSSDGSIGGSATINILTGKVLDVSARSDKTLPLGTGQTLEGRGTILGKLDTTGGGTVAPGGGVGGNTGTLTVTNTITLGGTTWMKVNRANSPNSDQLVSSTAHTINYGGTLLVTNIGAALQVGDTFTLFSGTTLSGSFTLALPSEYIWDTSQLNVNGSIKVAGIMTPPTITKADFSQLASSGAITIYANYPNVTNFTTPYSVTANVLSSTNIALPLSSWTIVTNTYYVVTNLVDYDSGNPPFTFYVNPTNKASFYILQTILPPPGT